MNAKNIQISIPVMTPHKFAEESGLLHTGLRQSRKESGETESQVVQGLIRKGHIPTVKVGKYRLVNVAQMTCECLDYEPADILESDDEL